MYNKDYELTYSTSPRLIKSDKLIYNSNSTGLNSSVFNRGKRKFSELDNIGVNALSDFGLKKFKSNTRVFFKVNSMRDNILY